MCDYNPTIKKQITQCPARFALISIADRCSTGQSLNSVVLWHRIKKSGEWNDFGRFLTKKLYIDIKFALIFR